jgi:hypothetical protein
MLAGQFQSLSPAVPNTLTSKAKDSYLVKILLMYEHGEGEQAADLHYSLL